MKIMSLALLTVGALVLAGCASNTTPPTPTTAAQSSTPVSSTPETMTPSTTTPMAPAPLAGDLSGEGSTFVAPILEKWRVAFQGQNPNVHISYLADGSGKGRASLIGNHVDFAGSDAPLSAAEMANATDALHIPVVSGGVDVVYNIPELSAPLKLDNTTIASIFLGTITSWDDPAIAALNPGVTLPHADITVVVRSDSSGTTATFTDYLNKADARWQKANGGPGNGGTVKWPAASTQTGNGNPGVASGVQSTKYAVGYVGSDWGNISQLQVATVKNLDGNFIAPSPATASAALDAAISAGAFSEQLTGSATNQHGANSYPITAVSWIIVHQHQSDMGNAKALVAFIHYVLHDGQALNAPNQYAPMPASMVTKADAILAKVDVNGQAVMSS